MTRIMFRDFKRPGHVRQHSGRPSAFTLQAVPLVAFSTRVMVSPTPFPFTRVALPHAVICLDLAGRDLPTTHEDSYRAGYFLTTTAEREIVRDIKGILVLAFRCRDFEEEMKKAAASAP
jgi:hypothetical protein